MTTPSTHWSEVGDKLDALGTKLKTHFQHTDSRGEVSDALQRIKVAFAEAVESAGNAVRDDAVKADVKEAGRLFVDALSASLAKVSENMRSDAPPQSAPSDSTGPTTPIEPPEPAH